MSNNPILQVGTLTHNQIRKMEQRLQRAFRNAPIKPFVLPTSGKGGIWIPQQVPQQKKEGWVFTHADGMMSNAQRHGQGDTCIIEYRPDQTIHIPHLRSYIHEVEVWIDANPKPGADVQISIKMDSYNFYGDVQTFRYDAEKCVLHFVEDTNEHQPFERQPFTCPA